MTPWARVGLAGLFLCAYACTNETPMFAHAERAGGFAANVDAERLERDVSALARGHADDTKLSCDGYRSEAKYPACQLSRDAAHAFVRARFDALGLTPQLVTLGAEPERAQNIVAELRGSERPREFVLVAAHIDAFYAGADDDSSGVAALLELSRLAVEQRFARSLRFVAFDLEERGSVGAVRYVEAGMADDVVAALVLECLGFAAHTRGSQKSPLGVPLGDVADALVVLGDAGSASLVQSVLALNHTLNLLPVRGVIASGDGFYPLTGALTRSDNGPLWLRGVPALLLTDTADYRNPHYHQSSDTVDTLDFTFFRDATRLAAASMAALAELQP